MIIRNMSSGNLLVMLFYCIESFLLFTMIILPSHCSFHVHVHVHVHVHQQIYVEFFFFFFHGLLSFWILMVMLFSDCSNASGR